MNKIFNKVVKNWLKILIIVLLLAGLVWLIWFINKDNNKYKASSAGSYVSGIVTEVLEDHAEADYQNSEGLRLGTQQIKVKITGGEHKNEIHEVTNNLSALYNIDVKKGTRVMLLITGQQNGSYHVTVYAYDRSLTIIVLLCVFVLLLTLIGGWKGLKSVVGLAFTLISIVFILIPLVSKGWSAISLSILIISVTTVICFLLLDGFNIKTVAAMISTISGVCVAWVCCIAVQKAAHLSGFNMQEAENLILISSNNKLHIKGLLTAGILIASMGAVMDIAISISSAICEMNLLGNRPGIRQLFKSGMNVGRDAMGTMANTLILAFAGTSLNMLLLVFSYGIPFFRLINTDEIAIEILQAIAGSIGIILTVPIAAIITSAMLNRKKENN